MGAGGSSRKKGDGKASSEGRKSKDAKPNQTCDAERQAVVQEVLELSNIEEPSHAKLKALTTSLRRNRRPPPDPLLVQSLDEAICKLVYEACSHGNEHSLLQLLEKHGDQYAHAKLFYAEGLTPLMLACENTNIDVIATLIEKNANPNERNNFKSTALHYAASLQATAMPLVLLLEAGAEPDPSNQLQATPAFHLLSNRLLSLDQQRSGIMLLKCGGLDLNKPDYDGNSLVFHANLQTTGGLHAVLCANAALAETGKTLAMGDKIVRAEVLKALMDCSPPQLNSVIDGVDCAQLDGQSIVVYKDVETKWVSQAAHRNPNWKTDLIRAIQIVSETHPHFDIDRHVDQASTSTLMQFMLECCVDPQYTPLFKHPIEAQIVEVCAAYDATELMYRDMRVDRPSKCRACRCAYMRMCICVCLHFIYVTYTHQAFISKTARPLS